MNKNTEEIGSRLLGGKPSESSNKTAVDGDAVDGEGGRLVNAEIVAPDSATISTETSKQSKEGFLDKIKESFAFLKEMFFASNIDNKRLRFSVEKDLKMQVRKPAIFGAIVLIVALGFFVVWGGLAPLDSAAVAEGHIVVSSEHSAIQHLEGGVIKEILVKDGEYVEAGQPLIILSDTAARAQSEIILAQLQFTKIIEKRLIAEAQELDSVDFSDIIIGGVVNSENLSSFIKNQQSIFELNKTTLKTTLDMQEQKIMQKISEIEILKAKKIGLIEALKASKEQFSIVEGLQGKGLDTKTRLLDSKSAMESKIAELSMTDSQIAMAREQIDEFKLSKIGLITKSKQENADNFRGTHINVLELEQKFHAVQDTLDRTVIRAPSAGIVTGLKYHTVGGVVQPAAVVMELVPRDDDLLVEAYLLPQHIESVYEGLETKVQLNAYKSRLVPRVDGVVTYVSADKFSTERGEQFYKLRIKLNNDMIAKINSDIKLYPGMPVTVFVIKGERTVLQYLLSPIIDSFHRAFKEP